MALHRIAVVGTGFGGTTLVDSLKGVDAEITLVDRRNQKLIQPLLYQVATSNLTPSDIAWPIRRSFRDRKDVPTVRSWAWMVYRRASCWQVEMRSCMTRS